MKTCDYCGKEIIFEQNEAGKWRPYELTGTRHNCKQRLDSEKRKEARK